MHLRTSINQTACLDPCVCCRHSGRFAAPLTGANAGYGKDLQGVQLPLDEANAKKIQIGGKTANFVIQAEDDQADPRIGVQAAQKLVDGGVAVVVGHFNSGTTIPASQVYQTRRHSGDRSLPRPIRPSRSGVSTTSSQSFPAMPKTQVLPGRKR